MWHNNQQENLAPAWMNAEADQHVQEVVISTAVAVAAPAAVKSRFGWFGKSSSSSQEKQAPPTPTAHEVPQQQQVQGTNPAYSGGWGANEYNPSWSQPSRYAPTDVEAVRQPAPAGYPPAYPTGPIQSHGGGPIALDIEPEVLEQMKKAHMATRVLYMTACILMGAAAGLALAPASAGTSSDTVAGSTNTINNGGTVNISTAFFAIYVLLFCLLICCFETGLNAFSNILAINFGFLYGRIGRLVFLLFVGFMSFSLSPFGIAAMAYLYLVGCIHIGIMFYYPKFSGKANIEHLPFPPPS